MSPRLSLQALGLYTVLKVFGFKGSAFPGQKLLAERAGISQRHIRRLLDELVHLGLIEIQRPDMNFHNHYVIKSVTPLLQRLEPHKDPGHEA